MYRNIVFGEEPKGMRYASGKYVIEDNKITVTKIDCGRHYSVNFKRSDIGRLSIYQGSYEFSKLENMLAESSIKLTYKYLWKLYLDSLTIEEVEYLFDQVEKNSFRQGVIQTQKKMRSALGFN